MKIKSFVMLFSLVYSTCVFAGDSTDTERKAWDPAAVGLQTAAGAAGAGLGAALGIAVGLSSMVSGSMMSGELRCKYNSSVCETVMFSNGLVGMTVGAAFGSYLAGKSLGVNGRFVPTMIGAGVAGLTVLLLGHHALSDTAAVVGGLALVGLGATAGYHLSVQPIVPIVSRDRDGSLRAGIAVQVARF